MLADVSRALSAAARAPLRADVPLNISPERCASVSKRPKRLLRAAVKGLQELSDALWDIQRHVEQVARFSSLASEKQLVFLVLGLFFFFFLLFFR